MHRATTAAAILLTLSLLGCDDGDAMEVERGPAGECERATVAEVECIDSNCLGRWDGTQHWSPAMPVETVDLLPGYDPGLVWQCDDDPDVDVCVIIDNVGHVACLRIAGEWAVSVAPACSGLAGVDVGCDMVAAAG